MGKPMNGTVGDTGGPPILCSSDSDCAAAGKTCELGVCVAHPCDTSSDCGTRGVCYAGFCQPTGSVPVGSECTADSQCPEGRICTDGYCIDKAGSFIKPGAFGKKNDTTGPEATYPNYPADAIVSTKNADGSVSCPTGYMFSAPDYASHCQPDPDYKPEEISKVVWWVVGGLAMLAAAGGAAYLVVHHRKHNPVKFDTRKLGVDLHQWHYGQDDPIYATGSLLYAGKTVPIDLLMETAGRVEMLEKYVAKTDRERRSLVSIRRRLQSIAVQE